MRRGVLPRALAYGHGLTFSIALPGAEPGFVCRRSRQNKAAAFGAAAFGADPACHAVTRCVARNMLVLQPCGFGASSLARLLDTHVPGCVWACTPLSVAAVVNDQLTY